MVAIVTTEATGTLVNLVTNATVVALGTVVVLNLSMSSCNVCCFCLILTKICVCREIPVKITNINFHVNVFEVFHEDRQKGEATDGRRGVTKLIDACLQLPCKKRNKNLILFLYK
jgi:hypothetical protein